MKIVILNTWGGRAHEALVSFVAKEAPTTDIFCFQEIWTSPREDVHISRETRVHLLEELSNLLSDFSLHFYPVQHGLDLEGPVDFELTEGQATFVRKALPVLASGQVFTRGSENSATDGWNDVPVGFGFVRMPYGAGELTVMNFHGIPFPGDKLDTPERLLQSQHILEFVEKEKGEVVLAGDFNLLPETESIRMIERARLTNLIQEYAIKTTRSRISPFYGKPDQQFFADFTFVSKGVSVKDFSVPEDCVASDHLPMILEFK